jgi:hypothetical protein
MGYMLPAVAAETAVNGGVIFIVFNKQFAFSRTDVTEHISPHVAF